MKSKKLNLKDLKVNSFITEGKSMNQIKGGFESASGCPGDCNNGSNGVICSGIYGGC